MKNKILILLFVALSVAGPLNVFALGAQGGSAPAPTTGIVAGSVPGSAPTPVPRIESPLKVKSIGGLIQSLVEIFSYIAVIIAVLALIYVGFKYVLYSAQGNSKKIDELHSWLLWIVVGVAIVIGARVIVEIAINTLSATGTVNESVLESARSAARGR